MVMMLNFGFSNSILASGFENLGIWNSGFGRLWG
jgi:hypothetical protein